MTNSSGSNLPAQAPPANAYTREALRNRFPQRSLNFGRLIMSWGSDKFLKKTHANIRQIHLGQISERQLQQQKPTPEKLFETNVRNEACFSDVWKRFRKVPHFFSNIIVSNLIKIQSEHLVVVSKYDWFTTMNIFGSKRCKMKSENFCFSKSDRTERHGAVRFGTIRYGTVRYGSVWHGMVRYGTVRYGTVRYGTVRHGTVWYDTVRYGTVRYGAIRYGTVRYGTERCGTGR